MNDQILLLGHGQLKALDNWKPSDQTKYQNILSFRLHSKGGAGDQFRRKHTKKDASVPNGDQVPSGKRVILEDISVYSSLSYSLSTTGTILAVDDSLELGLRWRARIAGKTLDYLNEAIPASGLLVAASPPPTGSTAISPSIPLGSIPMQSSQATLFPRSFGYRLPRPLVIGPGQTFQIQLRLTKSNTMCEYDVWAGGYMESIPS